jgi:branched-chain amino acid transport system substrate-binding protein
MRVFAALAVAALLFASPARAQISDDVVKLGVLTDLSGVYSDGTGKGSVAAAEMAVADFGGQVLGKPIRVVAADHQNKPDVGLAIARNWYDTGQVDAIVDVPTSSIALAVQQITREKNRVLLMSGTGSSELTGTACSPNGIHWTFDTYALSEVGAKAMVESGADTWFFITADYTFGHQLEREASKVVLDHGGKVLGAVRHPLNTADFSSYLLQAQLSGAKVIAFANAGHDTIGAVKQAAEFGIGQGANKGPGKGPGQKLLALLINLPDSHSLGAAAQGMILTEAFYWDLDDETRAFGKRFFAKMGQMPSMNQAGVYSATSHYLKAVQAAGTDEAKAVVAKMKAIPVNDFFAHNGTVRADGRMVHDMYLMQVKPPAEVKQGWDLYTLLQTVPGDHAYRPLKDGGCPLVAEQ